MRKPGVGGQYLGRHLGPAYLSWPTALTMFYLNQNGHGEPKSLRRTGGGEEEEEEEEEERREMQEEGGGGRARGMRRIIDEGGPGRTGGGGQERVSQGRAKGH